MTAMCSLIVLRGLDRAFPLFVAANRDERTDRAAAPPASLHVSGRPCRRIGLLRGGNRNGLLT